MARGRTQRSSLVVERMPGAEEERGPGHHKAGSAHAPRLLKTNMDNQGGVPRPTDNLLQDRPHHRSVPQPTRGQRMPRSVGNRRGPGWPWAVHLKSPTPLTPKGEDHQEWSRASGWVEEGTHQGGMKRAGAEWGQCHTAGLRTVLCRRGCGMSLKTSAESRAVFREEDHRSPVRTQRNQLGGLTFPATSQELPDHCPWKSISVNRRIRCAYRHMHTRTSHMHHTHTQSLYTHAHMCTRQDMHTHHTQIHIQAHSYTHAHTDTSHIQIHTTLAQKAHTHPSYTGWHTLYATNTHSKIHKHSQADI